VEFNTDISVYLVNSPEPMSANRPISYRVHFQHYTAVFCLLFAIFCINSNENITC